MKKNLWDDFRRWMKEAKGIYLTPPPIGAAPASDAALALGLVMQSTARAAPLPPRYILTGNPSPASWFEDSRAASFHTVAAILCVPHGRPVFFGFDLARDEPDVSF